jgi:hypothetical protein
MPDFCWPSRVLWLQSMHRRKAGPNMLLVSMAIREDEDVLVNEVAVATVGHAGLFYGACPDYVFAESLKL